MIRKLLSVLIEHIIGSYVENFDSENLSFGLINGNVTLNLLNLKNDCLFRLFNIPLILKSGKF